MSYLTEAFKALNALDEETFSVSDDGIKKLAEFEEIDDNTPEEITVYDVDAETQDDIEDSYVGKVILDCTVCHSKLYKNKEDVTVDEEQQVANIDDECPYCYSTEGFKVIGEVAPFAKVSETEETTEEEVASEDDAIEEPETSDMEESVSSSDNSSETLTEDCQTSSEDDLEEEDKPVEEAMDLATKENTVAGVLAKHMPEIYAITDVNELRKAVIDIVDNSDIADKAIVSKLRRDLFSKKSIGALLSTIATYMTGTKVAKVGRKNEDVEDTLEEAAEGKYVIRSGVSDANPYTWEYSRKTGKHFGYLGNGGRSWVSADSKSLMTFDSSEEADAFAKEHVKDKYKAEIVKVTGPLEEDWRDGIPVIEEFEKQLVERIPDFKLTGVREMVYYIKDDFRLWDSLENDGSAKIDLEDTTKSSDRFIYRATIKSFDEIPSVIDEIEKLVNNGMQEDVSLEESVKDVTITTDDSKTTMTSEDDGKVTVTTEPVETPDEDAEVLAPVSDETEMEIEDDSADDDLDVEEIDETSLDELGEGYFKNVYENVNAFKTIKCTRNGNQFIVEGMLTFDNNHQKKTTFIFESVKRDVEGKVKFLGENANICKGEKAFSLQGSIVDKKLICESLNYNYRTKNEIGKSVRCNGTIRRGNK